MHAWLLDQPPGVWRASLAGSCSGLTRIGREVRNRNPLLGDGAKSVKLIRLAAHGGTRGLNPDGAGVSRSCSIVIQQSTACYELEPTSRPAATALAVQKASNGCMLSRPLLWILSQR